MKIRLVVGVHCGIKYSGIVNQDRVTQFVTAHGELLTPGLHVRSSNLEPLVKFTKWLGISPRFQAFHRDDFGFTKKRIYCMRIISLNVLQYALTVRPNHQPFRPVRLRKPRVRGISNVSFSISLNDFLFLQAFKFYRSQTIVILFPTIKAILFSFTKPLAQNHFKSSHTKSPAGDELWKFTGLNEVWKIMIFGPDACLNQLTGFPE